MITLCRHDERRHIQWGKHDVWLTFFPQKRSGPKVDKFGILRAFDEMRHPPGGALASHAPDASEVITYVHRGQLTQEDSTGSSGVVQAGEFQRMTFARGVHCKETNASRTHWVHLFRISLCPSEAGHSSDGEQRRFAAAQRHNLLCVVASRDGRKGSLPVRQDAIICSSVLDPGHHLIHELFPGRSAWLHVLCGEATLYGTVLTSGDAAGLRSESAVSFTARDDSEILLVDVGPS